MKISFPFAPHFREDRQKYAVAVVYHRFTFGIALTALLLMVVTLAVDPTISLHWFVLFLFVEGSCIFGLIMNSRGRVRPAVVAFHAAFWIIATLFAVLAPSLVLVTITAYTVIVFSSGLLLGRDSAVVAAIVSGLGEVALIMIPASTAASALEPRYAIICLLAGWLFLVVAAVLPYLVVRSLRDAIRNLNRENEVLRRAREELERSDSRYKSLLDALPDAVLLHEAGKLIYVNPTGLRLIGFLSVEDVVGEDVLEFISPDLRPAFREQIGSLLEGGRPSGRQQYKVVRKDGEVADVEVVNILAGGNGNTGIIQTVLRDVTEQRLLQSKGLQAQRVDLMGQLIGGIAHDLGNIFGVILGHVQLMRKWPPEEGQFTKSLRATHNAGNRGIHLVKQLLAFSGVGEIKVVPVDLNGAIVEVIDLLRETFPESVVFKRRLHDGLPRIRADATQLRQVLMSLCVNAREAMPEGGEITISTGEVARRLLAERFPDLRSDKYVRLVVSDTGPGMSLEKEDDTQEPILPSRTKVKGGPLDLSVVHGLLKSHNGAVDVQTANGNRTIVSLYFPAYEVHEKVSVNDNNGRRPAA